MKLFFCVPLFTRDPVEVADRKKIVNDWWMEFGLPRIRSGYRFSKAEKFALEAGRSFDLLEEPEPTSTPPDLIHVEYSKRPGALFPKGLVLRLEILRAIDYVDTIDPRQRDDAFLVMMDGSGAFDFSNLFLIIDRLQTSPRADVVLGYRPETDTGMPDWRKAIELFEECLLISEFGDTIVEQLGSECLPDSQAGCWGICLGAMRQISLTAQSYELEYDLLSSVLAQRVPLAYVGPLKMSQRGSSEFSAGSVDTAAIRNSIRKLRFIMHKLALTSEELLFRLQEYLKSVPATSKRTLPDEYVRAVFAEHRVG